MHPDLYAVGGEVTILFAELQLEVAPLVYILDRYDILLILVPLAGGSEASS
jgi:hypothetical protein